MGQPVSSLIETALAGPPGTAWAQAAIAWRAVTGMAHRLGVDDPRVRLAVAEAETLAAALLADSAGPYGVADEAAGGNRAPLGGAAADMMRMYLQAQGDFAALMELKDRLADQVLAQGDRWTSN